MQLNVRKLGRMSFGGAGRRCRRGSDGACAGFSKNMNGCEKSVEFLPANSSRKVEKGGPRRWVVLVAVLAAFLALLAGSFWHGASRRVVTLLGVEGGIRFGGGRGRRQGPAPWGVRAAGPG